MKRRKFIKAGFFTVLASYLSFQKVFSGNLSDKSIVYEITGNPDAAIKLLFESFGGIKTLINKELSQTTVLVKPNLCLPHRDSVGTITSVATTKALCEYLISEGIGRIIIADHTLQTAEQFQSIEFVQYVQSNPKITLLLANEQKYYVQKEIEGKVLKNIEIMKILERIDYFINLPTAKHHTAAHVSLSLKNLMGIIWDRKVFHTGVDLDQAIADLAATVKPDLNIVDASRVLLNRGPVGPGPIEYPGKLFAGKDMVALDSIVVSNFNFGGKSLTAKEVPHIWASYKCGLGELETDKIEVVKLSA